MIPEWMVETFGEEVVADICTYLERWQSDFPWRGPGTGSRRKESQSEGNSGRASRSEE